MPEAHDSNTNPASALNPYSYASAPVGNFQAIVRPSKTENQQRYLAYYADGIKRAQASGSKSDLIHYTDLMAALLLTIRDEAERMAA